VNSIRHIPSLRQAGFSLVSAIFLLVVLAALGAAMVTISTMQQQSSALDVQGVRAYQAAKAGLEWALYQNIRSGTCPAAATNVSLPAGSPLSGFTVTVQCTPGTYAVITAAGITTAVITSTACSIPGADGKCPNGAPNNSNYVERKVEARL
jgi:MSHA biogenesis protein MshP